jgi:superfamily I DNA/RNA helicase
MNNGRRNTWKKNYDKPAPTVSAKPLPKLNHYGVAILDRLAEWDRNICVSAVAGSGKTTLLRTICSDARFARKSKLFAAYNKSIQQTLEALLPNSAVFTGHSLGFSMVRSWGYNHQIRKVQVERDKYSLILDVIMQDENYDVLVLGYEKKMSAIKSIEMCQVTLTNPEDQAQWEEVCAMYDLDFDTRDWVIKALNIGASTRGVTLYGVSFGDMIWLPVIHNMEPHTKYDLVLIDEAQDLSKALSAVICKHVADGGRVVAVGDPRQAIYGFAGSNPESFSDLVQTLGAIEMPLSVNYRCGKVHIESVKHLVPHIEAWDGAEEGKIESIDDEKFLDAVQQSDLVICRINAPLLNYAFKLLKKGKACKLANRGDLLDGLVSVVRRVLGKKKEFAMALVEIDTWEQNEKEKLSLSFRNPSKLAAKLDTVADKAECIRILVGNALDEGVSNLNHFKQWLDNKFPDRGNAITLSSIHRAKGLEANRVFLLCPDFLPLPRVERDGQEWEKVQEKNLEYVAKTRPLKEFFNVERRK